ncbi:MAG: hypothetical protein GXO47_02310, partial [Chlorobi bacterium]|nr:hypothetical protein [Chlorobiota bacterium]
LYGKYKNKRADIYIGTFNIIPKEKYGDPDFFKSRKARYFMIVNAFTTNKDEFADVLTQQVSFTINNDILKNKNIYRVSKNTGIEIKLTGIPNDKGTTFTTYITGGGFDFFVIR